MKRLLPLLLAVPVHAQEVPQVPEPEAETEEEVRIIGSREDLSSVGGSAHTVDRATLEAFEHDDIHRVLEQVPGAYVRQEDGFGLRPNIGIRGTSAERSAKITLMEDGILLAPAPYAAPAAYYFPLMTRLTGVEVFKGPAAIAYGPNTVGGAVNVVTRAIPRGSKGALDLGTGLYGSDKVHGWWGYGADRWGVLVEGVHLDSEGFKTLDGGGPTGFDKHEVMLKARLGSAPDAEIYQRLELKLGFADERSHETYLGLTADDFADTPYRRYAASRLDRMTWWRTQGTLTWVLEVGGDFELRTTAYRHDFSRAWRKLNSMRGQPPLKDLLAEPTGQNAVAVAVLRGEEDSDERSPLLVGTNDRSYFSQGLQSTGRLQLTHSEFFKQDVHFGLRVHQDAIERDHTEGAFLMRGGQLLRAEADASTARNTEGALAFAGHVQDELALGAHLRLSPGVRVEHIRTTFEDDLGQVSRDHAQTVLLPGVGAVVLLTPEWSLLAGAHRGFTPVAPQSGDTADPEEAWNYEAGTRFLTDTTRLEAIGFYSDYNNLLVPCSVSAGCPNEDVGRDFNGGEVDVVGLELLAAQAFRVVPGLSLQVDVSYTLTRSELEGRFDDPILGAVEPGDALPYVPEHQGNLTLRVIGRAYELDLSGHYVSALRDVAGAGEIPEAERIEGHFVLDVAGHWAVSEAGKLYGRLDNVLANDHAVSLRPYGLRPGKPFQAFVGYKHAFGG
jgi:Fe(3+) dicitrate transport protein